MTTAYFARNEEVESVLPVNSGARGGATRDSCLDLAVLATSQWLDAHEAEPEAERDCFERRDATMRAL